MYKIAIVMNLATLKLSSVKPSILFHFVRPEFQFWLKIVLSNWFIENKGYILDSVRTYKQIKAYSYANRLLKSILFYFYVVDHNQTPHMCGTCENLGEMTSFLCSRTDVPSRRGWTRSGKAASSQVLRYIEQTR